MSRDGLWIDVGMARGFAGRIQGGLGDMQNMLQSIESMLDGIYWEGDDARNFKADWTHNLRPEAARATQSLQQTSDELLHRAAAQERVSDGDLGVHSRPADWSR